MKTIVISGIGVKKGLISEDFNVCDITQGTDNGVPYVAYSMVSASAALMDIVGTIAAATLREVTVHTYDHDNWDYEDFKVLWNDGIAISDYKRGCAFTPEDLDYEELAVPDKAVIEEVRKT